VVDVTVLVVVEDVELVDVVLEVVLLPSWAATKAETTSTATTIATNATFCRLVARRLMGAPNFDWIVERRDTYGLLTSDGD
jgi:hypothetical protein